MPRNMVVGKLRVVGDGARSLDAEDKVKIYEQVEALGDLEIPKDHVLLLEPLYPELDYGPGNVHDQQENPRAGNIKFHGGTWSGPADHSNLVALLKSHPEIIELRPAEAAAKTYACAVCDQEFETKAKADAHTKAAHK